MSVKEMAKGITYDDPIKTRCVSEYRGCLSETTASWQLKRTSSHTASQAEHWFAATGFSLALLSGFLLLSVRSKAVESLWMLFYGQ